jgi:hypothetical protein
MVVFPAWLSGHAVRPWPVACRFLPQGARLIDDTSNRLQESVFCVSLTKSTSPMGSVIVYLFLTIIAVSALTYFAWSFSGAAQVQLQQNSSNMTDTLAIAFYDPATSPTTRINSVADIANEAFRAYATGAIAALRQVYGDDVRGQVRVVRIPAVASSDRPLALPNLNAALSSPKCSASSPWAEIAVGDESDGPIDAVLIWNERQLIFDMSERGTHAEPAPRQPYTQSFFEQAALRYGAAIAAGQDLPADDLPADLDVLFKRSPQSTLLPFSANAYAKMERIAADNVAECVDIVTNLAAFCASGATGSHSFSQVSDIPVRP